MRSEAPPGGQDGDRLSGGSHPPPPFRLQSPGSNTWLYPVAQEARWVQGNIGCTHSSKFHASGRLH